MHLYAGSGAVVSSFCLIKSEPKRCKKDGSAHLFYPKDARLHLFGSLGRPNSEIRHLFLVLVESLYFFASFSGFPNPWFLAPRLPKLPFIDWFLHVFSIFFSAPGAPGPAPKR